MGNVIVRSSRAAHAAKESAEYESQARVGQKLTRGRDRTITSVACRCSMHLYAWRTRTWFAKLASGGLAEILAGEVPLKCRTEFAPKVS